MALWDSIIPTQPVTPKASGLWGSVITPKPTTPSPVSAPSFSFNPIISKQPADDPLSFNRDVYNTQRATTLAKAISIHESGGKQVKGASGEFGAFQFMPATWQTISKQTTGKVLPQTPQNEMTVAEQKIKSLLDAGHSVRDVALIWNTSLGGSEKSFIVKGKNKKGVPFDSGDYANKVEALYHQLSNTVAPIAHADTGAPAALATNIVKDTITGLPQAAKDVGNKVKGFLVDTAKSAFQDVFVTPTIRTEQAIVSAVKPNADKSFTGEQDITIDTPFGQYTVPAQRTGVSGAKQIAGQALKSASWLVAPSQLMGIGKGVVSNATIKSVQAGLPLTDKALQETFFNVVKEGFKSGALIGGVQGLGESFWQDSNLSDTAKQTAIGALFGGALGATGAGSIAGIQIAKNKIGFIQSEIVKQLIDQGMSEKQARIFASQSGFIKNPIGGGELPLGQGGKTTPSSEAPTLSKPLPAETVAQLPQKASSFPDTTINTENINISQVGKDTINRVVEEVKPAIEKIVGKKLGNDEAIKLADQSSKILSQVVARDDTLTWQASLLKARQALAAASESGTVDEAYIKNLLTIKTQGTDIARKLQSFGIGADAVEPTAKQAILEAVLKVSKNADEIIKAAKGVDFTNLKQATEFYRKFIKPTSSEWIDLIRYNSMLSSPKTHIVNTVSNFMNTGIIAPFEKTLTGGLDFLGSKITGNKRTAFAGEGIQYARGALSSTRDAAFRFADVMRGNRTYTNLDTRNIPIATTGVKGKLISTLSFPIRLLEGMDQFFTALAEGGQTSALKYRAFKGVKVGNIEAAAQRDAAYRLYRQKPLPKQEGHLLNAVDQFTVMIQELRNNKNPIVSNIAKFTVPFLQTPMNIFKQGLEYSPVGFGTLPGAANKTEQLSKALIGSSIYAGAATLLASNRLTWGEPVASKDKAAFRAAGMQAYSVKIGDKWYSYQKLPPGVAFPLAMVAAIHDTQINAKLDDNTVDLVLSGIAKYGQFLADQSYAKSIGDLLAAAKGGEAGVQKVISNYGQQLVPYRALGGWLARLTDDTQRKIDSQAGFVDQQVQLLMMNLPGLSKKVPARLDNQGNPIPQQFPVINAFSSVAVSKQTPEQERQYQNYSDIKQLSQKTSQESAALKDKVIQTLSTMKELSKEDAKAQLKQLAQTDPELVTKILDVIKSDAKTAGLTADEQTLLGSSLETRAEFIYEQRTNYASKDEYKKYLKDLATKNILTKATLERLTELLQKK